MTKHTEDIRLIRDMMEKSSKFISLSGFSGIFAGIVAILGASFAYYYFSQQNISLMNISNAQNLFSDSFSSNDLLVLTIDAFAMIIISIGLALYFSGRKAKKLKQKLFNNLTKRIIYNLAIPLLTGGLICIFFLWKGSLGLTLACTLVFYGLALVNVSKYTLDTLHYLGLTEVVLGLLSFLFIEYSFMFWVLGFGICHILYGGIMYYKYDRN